MLFRSSAGIGYMNKRTALKAESTSEGKEWTSGQSEALGGMGGRHHPATTRTVAQSGISRMHKRERCDRERRRPSELAR